MEDTFNGEGNYFMEKVIQYKVSAEWPSFKEDWSTMFNNGAKYYEYGLA